MQSTLSKKGDDIWNSIETKFKDINSSAINSFDTFKNKLSISACFTQLLSLYQRIFIFKSLKRSSLRDV